MQALRFLMLLALVVWVGGIIFFAAVLAPTVFRVLPTHDLAGRVVSPSLMRLHWMGLVSGLVFLACSFAYSRLATGFVHPGAARNLLIVAMIVLTLVSIYVVGARMEHLRSDMGVIDNISLTDARRVEFNSLHHWSTRIEVAVLVMGLATLCLTGKAINT